MTIAGAKNTSFKTQDGKIIEGVTLYTLEEADGVIGKKADKAFIPARLGYTAQDFRPGDEIILYYNKYGKVQNVSVC